MPDPRQNVRPGQRLQIAAEQINFLNRLMRTGGGFGSGSLPGWLQGTNIIAARNSASTTVPRGGVLKISGIEIDPEKNATTEAQFCEMPCVVGSAPQVGTRRIAIAAEPIPAGKIGKVFVSGVAVARVDVISESHGFAKATSTIANLESCAGGVGVVQILWVGDRLGPQWALVRLGAEQTIVLGKFIGAWPKGQKKEVRVYTEDEGAKSDYIEALNIFCEVGDSCGPERWAALLQYEADWYLLAAEC